MLQKLKKNQSGFSIVEVMIVLAIAGLIILVVFLAVPALNRNSRNTTTKQAVSSIGALVGEFRGANAGKNPTGISVVAGGGQVTVAGATGTNPITGNADSIITTVTTQTGQSPAAPPLGTVIAVAGGKCSSPTSNITTPAARSVALVFSIESSSGTVVQCLDA